MLYKWMKDTLKRFGSHWIQKSYNKPPKSITDTAFHTNVDLPSIIWGPLSQQQALPLDNLKSEIWLEGVFWPVPRNRNLHFFTHLSQDYRFHYRRGRVSLKRILHNQTDKNCIHYSWEMQLLHTSCVCAHTCRQVLVINPKIRRFFTKLNTLNF